MVFTDSQLPFYYQWQRMIAQELIGTLNLLATNEFESAADCLSRMKSGLNALEIFVGTADSSGESERMAALGQHLFGFLLATQELSQATGSDLESCRILLMQRAIAQLENASPDQLMEATGQMLSIAKTIAQLKESA